MRRGIIAIVALFFVLITIGAQEFNLSFVKPQSVDKNTGSIRKSVTINNRLLTIRSVDDGQQELTVRAISDMSVLKKRIIIGGRETNTQTLSGNFGIVNLVRLDKRIYLLVQSIEKSSNRSVLLSQELNSDGDFVGGLKEIDAMQVERESNVSGFVAVVSVDSTKLLVVTSPPSHKKQQEQFVFKTMDNELKGLAKIGIELPQSDQDFHSLSAILNKNGIIVFSGYYDLEKKEVAKDFERQRMVVYIIEPSGTYKDYEVTIPKLELFSVKTTLSKDNNTLWVNGLYRDIANGKKDEENGIVSVKINISTKEIISKKIAPFGKDLIAKANNEKVDKIQGDDGIPYRYRSKDYLLNDDGTMWALLEKRYSVYDKYGSYNYFQSIIALHIGNDGAIQSSVFIPKQQVMGSLSFSIGSFYASHNGQRLFLIMNDHEDNTSEKAISEKDCKIQANSQKSNLFAVEVRPDGTYSKKVLYKNEGMVCLVDAFVKIDDGNVLFEVRKPGLMGIPKMDEVGYCILNVK